MRMLAVVASDGDRAAPAMMHAPRAIRYADQTFKILEGGRLGASRANRNVPFPVFR
jgi:hypothetical protein